MKDLKKKPDHTDQNTYALPPVFPVFLSQYGSGTRPGYRLLQSRASALCKYRKLPVLTEKANSSNPLCQGLTHSAGTEIAINY
jgi:hypothetical protein